MEKRAGIVDVGSNTVRLVVVGREGIHATKKARLGLGREIEAHGRLSDAKIAETAAAVEKLCAKARKQGVERLEVLVTAPGRQAENARELVRRLEHAAGERVRVLSVEEEARLSFTAATVAVRPDAGSVCVCDLGGASTELAVGPPWDGPAWIESVELGALRLAVRTGLRATGDPAQIAAAREAAREAFAALDPPWADVALVVGGTARALGRIAGPRLGTDELEDLVDRLACEGAKLRKRHDIGRRRSELLLSGTIILAEVQRLLRVPLEVTKGGVREGAALNALAA
jgi:exopolyphosphatase/guanosine-5'-triphosphate,3'-diphosphate pyrophosphatase